MEELLTGTGLGNYTGKTQPNLTLTFLNSSYIFFVEVFLRYHIDLNMTVQMTEHDLISIGITSNGAKKYCFKQLKA
jgi:hypothetical protein